MNRKWLPPVHMATLSIDQKPGKKLDPALPANYHDEVESILFITIEKYRESYVPRIQRRKYGAIPVKKALEKFDHMLPRMFIEDLHLELAFLDDFTLHQLLEKFKKLNIKCQNLFVATLAQKFQLNDLRSILLQLEPKKLHFKIYGENTSLMSSFWQEKCIRDLQELYFEANPNLSFDDQLLLGLTSPIVIIHGFTSCTFDGIASFLEEWKTGTREVKYIYLSMSETDLNINAFVAMLPWVECRTTIEPDYGCYCYSTYIVNSRGNKIDLSVKQFEFNGNCFFEMIDVDYNRGRPCNNRLYDHDGDDDSYRKRLRLCEPVDDSEKNGQEFFTFSSEIEWGEIKWREIRWHDQEDDEKN